MSKLGDKDQARLEVAIDALLRIEGVDTIDTEELTRFLQVGEKGVADELRDSMEIRQRAYKQDLDEKKADIESLQEDLRKETAKLETAEKQLTKVLAERDTLQASKKNLKEKFEVVKGENKTLKVERDNALADLTRTRGNLPQIQTLFEKLRGASIAYQQISHELQRCATVLAGQKPEAVTESLKQLETLLNIQTISEQPVTANENAPAAPEETAVEEPTEEVKEEPASVEETTAEVKEEPTVVKDDSTPPENVETVERPVGQEGGDPAGNTVKLDGDESIRRQHIPQDKMEGVHQGYLLNNKPKPVGATPPSARKVDGMQKPTKPAPSENIPDHAIKSPTGEVSQSKTDGVCATLGYTLTADAQGQLDKVIAGGFSANQKITLCALSPAMQKALNPLEGATAFMVKMKHRGSFSKRSRLLAKEINPIPRGSKRPEKGGRSEWLQFAGLQFRYSYRSDGWAYVEYPDGTEKAVLDWDRFLERENEQAKERLKAGTRKKKGPPHFTWAKIRDEATNAFIMKYSKAGKIDKRWMDFLSTADKLITCAKDEDIDKEDCYTIDTLGHDSTRGVNGEAKWDRDSITEETGESSSSST